MKVKLDDRVVPRHQLGKIVGITKDEVSIEVPAKDGTRITKLTREMADLRGVSLDQLVDEAIVIVTEPEEVEAAINEAIKKQGW